MKLAKTHEILNAGKNMIVINMYAATILNK